MPSHRTIACGAMLCAIIAAGLAAFAIATPNWAVLDYGGHKELYGIARCCGCFNNAGDISKCQTVSKQDILDCENGSNKSCRYWEGSLACVVLGTITATLGAIAVFFGLCTKSSVPRHVSGTFLVIAAFFFAGGLGLFVTTTKIYFAQAKVTLSWSFVLMVLSCLLDIVTVVLVCWSPSDGGAVQVKSVPAAQPNQLYTPLVDNENDFLA